VAAPCINDFREASTRIQPYAQRMPLMKVEQTEMKSISKLSRRGNFVPRRIGDLLSEPDWMTVARQELSFPHLSSQTHTRKEEPSVPNFAHLVGDTFFVALGFRRL